MEYKKRKPTARQKSVFNFIRKHILSKGFPPTVREVAGHFGFASPLSAQLHINALVKKGFIRKSPFKQRTIEIPGLTLSEETKIPLLGRVRAGAPILALEEIEDYISVDRDIFRIENGFALRVTGDSMIEAGIFEGDIALIEPGREPADREIVVALIGEEATIKRFFSEGAMVRLAPENSEMKPLVIRAEDVRIVGKVAGILRRL